MCHLATNDFVSLNENFTLSDDALIQCVPIEIVSDSVAEDDQDCFTISISSPNSVSGLSVSPSEAEICISDEEGNSSLCIVEYLVFDNGAGAML